MLIEYLTKRANGSNVTIGGEKYHFAPSAAHGGAHVAEVSIPEHVERMLSLPTLYRPAEEPKKPQPAAKPAQKEQTEAAPQADDDIVVPPRRPGRPRKAE